MKIFNILYYLSGVHSVLNNNQPTCHQVVTRKELRQLSYQELNQLKLALNKAHNTKLNNGDCLLDYFTKVHIQMYKQIHGTIQFFPWHRHFVYLYEKTLKQIDPTLVMPYWDWTLESENPNKSNVLSDAYFGGDGDRKNDYCVKDGPFKNWTLKYPTPHCLRRNFMKTINGTDYEGEAGPFPPMEVIQAGINSSPIFSDFTKLTHQLHGYVHNNLGGIHGDLLPSHSPNDPLFFFHHSFMDYIWWLWQKKYPTMLQYEGSTFNITVSENDKLEFGDSPSIAVRDTFDTTKYPYCYTFAIPKEENSAIPSNTRTQSIDFTSLDNLSSKFNNLHLTHQTSHSTSVKPSDGLAFH